MLEDIQSKALEGILSVTEALEVGFLPLHCSFVNFHHPFVIIIRQKTHWCMWHRLCNMGLPPVQGMPNKMPPNQGVVDIERFIVEQVLFLLLFLSCQ